MKYCQFSILVSLLVWALLLPIQGGRPVYAGTLKETIDGILASSGLSKTRHSIQITSLPERRVLYESNPYLALNPASNVKLVTAAAALHELGPDFTFKTEFYSDTLLREGRLRNLWIRGNGDPLFVTEELD